MSADERRVVEQLRARVDAAVPEGPQKGK
jgi:hypothetical protein